jgi:hypothetical protein
MMDLPHATEHCTPQSLQRPRILFADLLSAWLLVAEGNAHRIDEDSRKHSKPGHGEH